MELRNLELAAIWLCWKSQGVLEKVYFSKYVVHLSETKVH